MKKNMEHLSFKEIHSLAEMLESGYDLRNATIQNIDFTELDLNWKTLDLYKAVFLGCKLSTKDQLSIVECGGTIFPEFSDIPYNPYRSNLYSWQEMYQVSESGTSVDFEIYQHFSKHKYDPSMMEALCQRIHDNSIDDALRDFLRPNSNGTYQSKAVGIMGGHGTLRSDPYYLEVAKTAHSLSNHGYLVCSGGGPGIMEAANLGAYFSLYSVNDLELAIRTLSNAPHFADESYHQLSTDLLDKFPEGGESLAIPTWFYGHEPSNVFASHIAKYFSNSIREDTLLAICLHGIVFAPGSAGTTQEIFMDAAQNHYGTFGYVSPMIFLGIERYSKETNLFETLKQLAADNAYSKSIHLVDEAEDAVKAIMTNPPFNIK